MKTLLLFICFILYFLNFSLLALLLICIVGIFSLPVSIFDYIYIKKKPLFYKKKHLFLIKIITYWALIIKGIKRDWEHLFEYTIKEIVNYRTFIFKLILASIVIWVFIPFFSYSLETVVIKTLFRDLKSNTFIDSVSLIYLLGCLLFFSYKFHGSKSLSTYNTILYLFLSINYFLFTKINPSNWNFITFQFPFLRNKNIYYLDAILIGPLAIWLFCGFVFFFIKIASYIKNHKTKLDKNIKGLFIEDKFPTYLKEWGIDEDFSQRSKHASELVKKLIHTKTDTAIAVGITGSWGSGKSYYLNLAKEEISKKKYTKQIVHFDFSPWKNEGSKSIYKDFFNVISLYLSKYNGDIATKASSYLETLLKEDKSTLAKGVRVLFSNSTIPSNTTSEYLALGKAIAKINKKVFIFIDDLDRLDSKEIAITLKLIRNVANFKNVIFIAAYDKTFVTKAIESTFTTYQSSFFLDKIFQLEVTLPIFNRENLISILSAAFNGWTKDIPLETINYVCKLELTWSYLANIRDLQRFLNLFFLDFDSIKNEVSFLDYFFMTLIQLKYNQVYLKLYEQKDTFFIREFDAKHYSLRTYITFDVNNNEIPQEYLIDYIKSLDDLSTDEQDLLLGTINFLLSPYSDNRTLELEIIEEKRPQKQYTDFAIHNSFHKYFAKRVFKQSFSYGDLLTIIKEDKQEIINQFKTWEENNQRFHILNCLKERLLHNLEAIATKEDFIKISEALLSLNSDYYDIIKLIIGTPKNIAHFFNNNQNDFSKFLEESIEKSENINLFYYIIKTNDSFFNINPQRIQKAYSKHTINEIQKIGEQKDFTWDNDEYYKRIKTLTDNITIERDDDTKHSPDVSLKVRELILQDIDNFIKRAFRRESKKDSNFIFLNYRLRSFLSYIFNSLDDFIELYNEKLKGTQLSYKTKLFFETLCPKWIESRKNEHQKFIPFYGIGLYFNPLEQPPIIILKNKSVKETLNDLILSLDHFQDNYIWIEKLESIYQITNLQNKNEDFTNYIGIEKGYALSLSRNSSLKLIKKKGSISLLPPKFEEKKTYNFYSISNVKNENIYLSIFKEKLPPK